VSFTASSEHSSLVTCPSRARGGRLPWGSSPLSRHECEQSIACGFPKPPAFPPSAFRTLSTVCSCSHRAGLFHPATTCEVFSSGFSPDYQDPGLSPGFPLSALSSFSYGRVAPTAPDPDAPPSGACSDSRSVAAARCFTPGDTRSPLEFSLPRVFLRAPWTRLRGSSAHELAPPIPLVTPAAALQRLDRCAAFPTVSSRSSRSSFLAFQSAFRVRPIFHHSP
jgi:hypothetical protein